MYYVCQYKRRRRINLGRVGVITPAQARDKALSILGDVAKGLDPSEVSKRNNLLTLKDFLEKEYTPWIIAHQKAATKTIALLTQCFVKPFGAKPLIELTPALLDQWRTQRLKNSISAETVNRNIATLKAAISKAVLWGLIETHPLERFKLLNPIDQSR